MAMLDKDKMLQALLNIIINAVQASPCNGSVKLCIVPEADSGGGQWWRISVEDDGPGMSYEVQAKLFTPYFTTRPEGTGLGLAITNHIVEQHRGRLEVFSLPGRGSRFSILLPYAR